MTLEERIREILGYYSCWAGDVGTEEHKVFTEKFLTAILQAFQEVIPEELVGKEEFMYEEGWNACLAELRKNMGGGK